MKKFLTFILLICLFGSGLAQTSEVLTKQEFQAEKKKINDAINGLKRTDSDVKKLISVQGQTIDSLHKLTTINKELTAKNYDSVSGLSLKVARLEEQDSKQRLLRSTFLPITLLILLVLIIILFILFFRHKKSTELNMLSIQEDNKKMIENIEAEFKSLQESVRQCKEGIKQCQEESKSMADGLKQQIQLFTDIEDGKIRENHEELAQYVKKQEETISSLRIMIEKNGKEMVSISESSAIKNNEVLKTVMEDINKLKLQVKEHLTHHKA